MSIGPAYDVKEQVRQSIDIVDLVGSYVQLRRQGRNYVGLCPWHDDSRPSLQVNAERQSFKCWVCDVGGDVFSFIMKAEGLEFREALELLAERAGIALRPAAPSRPRSADPHDDANRELDEQGENEPRTPSEPPGSFGKSPSEPPGLYGKSPSEPPGLSRRPSASSPSPSRSPSPSPSPTAAEYDKRTLYRVMAWAELQFHDCLLSAAEADAGRQYLAERGISVDSARRFQLGFAPNRWDWLLERARGTEWTPAILERVGLLRRRESGGGFYDWFRGRVMFSIRDARSRPIGFGGRVLPQLADERAAKYINSPETPLFSKSRELYGLDLARDHFKRGGGAVVMEGYTDCLMAHQHELQNCVAVLGTALGERHLQLLRRYTDSITLVLDGDDAGRRRTNEILDALLALFEKNQVDLRILTLPEGLDPCDFIAQHGCDSFRELLAGAVDALEHKFRSVTKGLDILTDTHGASQATEDLLSTLAKIRPAGGGASSRTLLREEQMLSRIARQFHLPEEQLRSRLAALRREARRPHVSPPADAPQPARSIELPACDRLLLELLIARPEFSARIRAAIDPNVIESDVARQVYQAWLRLADDGMGPSFQQLIAEFDDSVTKSLLAGLAELFTARPTTDAERLLQDCLSSYQRRRAKLEQRRDLAVGRADDDFALQAIQRLKQERSASELRMFEQKRK